MEVGQHPASGGKGKRPLALGYARSPSVPKGKRTLALATHGVSRAQPVAVCGAAVSGSPLRPRCTVEPLVRPPLPGPRSPTGSSASASSASIWRMVNSSPWSRIRSKKSAGD